MYNSKMTKLIQRTETNLRSFFIFNSTFGKGEGEEYKKVVFYHPRDIEQNTKIWDIGLSEAIAMFTGTFTEVSNCKSLHTQKTTQIFYQPEINYWMVLVLNVPKEIRSKDGVEVPEYRGCEVQDRFYHGLLKHYYNMFKLRHGTFTMNEVDTVLEPSQQKLRQHADTFFSQFIENIKLPLCDAIESMCSLVYLPLDKSLFLNTYNAVNTIKAAIADIEEALILHNTHIICQGKLDPQELYGLHSYLMDIVFAKSEESDEKFKLNVNGLFYTKAENPNHEDDEDKLKITTPKVYLNIKKTLKPFHVVIYRVLNVTLCLLIKDEIKLTSQFYGKLLEQIEVTAELPLIAEQLEASISRTQSSNASNGSTCNTTAAVAAAANANDSDTISVKYLFIDELSHRHRTNLCFDLQRHQDIPRNVISLLLDLYQTQADTGARAAYCSQHIQIKTTNDFWIIGRRYNSRQFFVIIFNGKASLFNVSCEAKNILEQELTNDEFFGK